MINGCLVDGDKGYVILGIFLTPLFTPQSICWLNHNFLKIQKKSYRQPEFTSVHQVSRLLDFC